MLSPVNSMLSCLPLPLGKHIFVTHAAFVHVTTEQEREIVCHRRCHAGFHSNQRLYQLISLIREGERRETNHWNQLVTMKTSTLTAHDRTSLFLSVKQILQMLIAFVSCNILYVLYMCGCFSRT